MKKLPISLLLGVSLTLNINLSYSRTIDSSDPFFWHINSLVMKFYQQPISSVTLPDTPSDPNQTFDGKITGNVKGNNWEIRYRISKYDDLDEIEKIVFDNLQLDKNLLVTILGFSGTYYDMLSSATLPINGHFIQNSVVNSLSWVLNRITGVCNLSSSSFKNNVSISNYTYQDITYKRDDKKFYINKKTQH